VSLRIIVPYGCAAPRPVYFTRTPHSVPHPAPGFRHDLTSPTHDLIRGGAGRPGRRHSSGRFVARVRPPRGTPSRAVPLPVYTSQNATTRPRPAPGCGSLRSRPPSRVARRSRAPRPAPGARLGRNVLHVPRIPRAAPAITNTAAAKKWIKRRRGHVVGKPYINRLCTRIASGP